MRSISIFETENWPPLSFALVGAGGEILAALPPTVGFDGLIGQPDPYTWERAPGSAAWFPLGDGLPKEPYQIKLRGDWTYRTVKEAAGQTARITAALREATALHWCGQQLAELNPLFAGVHQYSTGARYIDVTHLLTCYTSGPLNPDSLPDLPDWNGGGTGGGTGPAAGGREQMDITVSIGVLEGGESKTLQTPISGPRLYGVLVELLGAAAPDRLKLQFFADEARRVAHYTAEATPQTGYSDPYQQWRYHNARNEPLLYITVANLGASASHDLTLHLVAEPF